MRVSRASASLCQNQDFQDWRDFQDFTFARPAIFAITENPSKTRAGIIPKILILTRRPALPPTTENPAKTRARIILKIL